MPSASFTAKQVPNLGGTFSGTLNFPAGAANVTATLTEGSGYSLTVQTTLSGAYNGTFAFSGSAVANVMFVSGSVNGTSFSLFGYFDATGQFTGTPNSIAVFDDNTLTYYGLLIASSSLSNVTGITISPTSANAVVNGGTASFTAQATVSSGSPVDITSTATWSISSTTTGSTADFSVTQGQDPAVVTVESTATVGEQATVTVTYVNGTTTYTANAKLTVIAAAAAANVLAIAVDGGPTAKQPGGSIYPNAAFASATICAPGSTCVSTNRLLTVTQ
jgi:hypothetical protein